MKKRSYSKLSALALSLLLVLTGCDVIAPPSQISQTSTPTENTAPSHSTTSESATVSTSPITTETTNTSMESTSEQPTEPSSSGSSTETTTEQSSSSGTSSTTADPNTDRSGLGLHVQARTPSADVWTPITDGAWERWSNESSLPLTINGNYDVFREQADSDKPLEGAIVLLDPGHGDWDPGALKEDLDPPLLEKNINLGVGLEAKAILENLGAKVIMSREDDTGSLLYYRIGWIGLESLAELERIVEAQGGGEALDLSWVEDVRPGLEQMLDIHSDRFNEDVSESGRSFAQGVGMSEEMRMLLDLQGELRHMVTVSIHVNSVAEPTRFNQGLIVYHYTPQQMWESELQTLTNHRAGQSVGATPISPAYSNYASEQTYRLATSIFAGFDARVPELLNLAYIERDGVYFNDVRTSNLGITRETNLSTILIEMGFITDENDLAVMSTAEGQAKIGAGIADGVRRYFAEEVWKD